MGGTNPAKGRTIRIFLADGSPNGVLTAEIMNWIGKAVVAPRARLPDLVARPVSAVPTMTIKIVQPGGKVSNPVAVMATHLRN